MSMLQHTAPDPGAVTPDRSSASTTANPLQRAVALRVAAIRIAIIDRTWQVMHVLGAHRWTDGYDVDPERGMTRYRGSRCSICDNPWEGW